MPSFCLIVGAKTSIFGAHPVAGRVTSAPSGSEVRGAAAGDAARPPHVEGVAERVTRASSWSGAVTTPPLAARWSRYARAQEAPTHARRPHVPARHPER